MRYFVDIEELSLLDLLDLRAEAAMHVVEMDDENFWQLCGYIASRDDLVQRLEAAKSLPSHHPEHEIKPKSSEPLTGIYWWFWGMPGVF